MAAGKPKPRLEITLTDEAREAFALLAEAVKVLSEINGVTGTGSTDAPSFKHWTVQTFQGTRYGYVDDANQEHFVSEENRKTVPVSWRAVYVQDTV